jgi:hypothetical protein
LQSSIASVGSSATDFQAIVYPLANPTIRIVFDNDPHELLQRVLPAFARRVARFTRLLAAYRLLIAAMRAVLHHSRFYSFPTAEFHPRRSSRSGAPVPEFVCHVCSKKESLHEFP